MFCVRIVLVNEDYIGRKLAPSLQSSLLCVSNLNKTVRLKVEGQLINVLDYTGTRTFRRPIQTNPRAWDI